jgi:hypothetical protein
LRSHLDDAPELRLPAQRPAVGQRRRLHELDVVVEQLEQALDVALLDGAEGRQHDLCALAVHGGSDPRGCEARARARGGRAGAAY